MVTEISICMCVYVKEKYAIYMKHPVYSCIQLVSKDCLYSVVLGWC